MKKTTWKNIDVLDKVRGSGCAKCGNTWYQLIRKKRGGNKVFSCTTCHRTYEHHHKKR